MVFNMTMLKQIDERFNYSTFLPVTYLQVDVSHCVFFQMSQLKTKEEDVR